MKLHEIFHRASVRSRFARGFTLIEIVVSIALMVSLFSFGSFVSMNTYQGYAFRGEENLLVGTLLHARALAMSNVDASTHGLCYVEIDGVPYYVTFRGTSCDPSFPTSQKILSNKTVSVTGLSDTDVVVFAQLSGTTTDKIITLRDATHSRVISINHEGAINW